MKQNIKINNIFRLNKLIASTGLASRREADELIKTGEVIVNGKIIINPGTLVTWGKDSVKVSGKLITQKEPLVYYVFNKPSKVISTLFDPKQRPCIKDYIKQIKARVIPVDMLAFDASGIILLTNDGYLINAIENNPNIIKTFKIKISGTFSTETLFKVIKKFKTTDKNPSCVKVKYLNRTQKNFWISITITSMSNKEIDFSLKRYGWDTLKWIRIKYFEISLKGLEPGSFRQLSKHEISILQKLYDSQENKKAKKAP